MTDFVLALSEVDRRQVAMVGSKTAHLGELLRMEGVRVPDGFCVTASAFAEVVAARPEFDALQARLMRVAGVDRPRAAWLRQAFGVDQASIRTLSAELGGLISGVDLPDTLTAAIARAHARLGAGAAYAVRSSATAEDLPTASFAGQQDTFLNVVGLDAILQHVVRCWASLFTERAVTYRLEKGFDRHGVRMAVVVQRMVPAEVAGVVFTADPVSGNRKITAVEASFGLGEALVSGAVDADAFQVREGVIVARTIAQQRLAARPSQAGGVHQQMGPSLTDAQVLRLAALGRRIEAHFGTPQDIEWCLADDEFHVVQSRPITTLFPIPEAPIPAAPDGTNRVYVSVGHQQMMTDPMRPLGLSLWQMKARVPMSEAGGRLFVDVTAALSSPAGRAGLLGMLGRSDPLIGDALQTLVDRADFLPLLPPDGLTAAGPTPAGAPPVRPIEADPAIVAALVARSQAALAALKRDIQGKSGSA
ncbi:MAG: phosphoenolpyruvate synthase, partial [Deltaproteobacteria bacterium]|nr:phosphoenolpyruvate synthase [Deltaproteobacteria bacterium]